ncbi:MAG: type II secretion system protein N [Acidiferrobacterales bacterium]
MSITAPGQLMGTGQDLIATLRRGSASPLFRRWLPAFINVAALAIFAWGMAGWTWMLVVPNVPQVIPDRYAGAGSQSLDMQPILDAQIFGQAPQMVGAGGGSLDAIPVSGLNLVLAGVVAAGGASFALISVDGRPQEPFAIGQEVTAGAVLQAVYPDRVLLSRNGVSEVLMLEGVKGGNAGVSVGQMPSAGPSLTGIRERGENEYVVPRSVINAELHQPQKLLTQALMVPDPGGGFLVREIQPDSVYQKLGLHVGDVIRSVNGQPVNTMQQAMRVYQQSLNLSNVQIQIVRNGRPEVLQYQVQ